VSDDPTEPSDPGAFDLSALTGGLGVPGDSEFGDAGSLLEQALAMQQRMVEAQQRLAVTEVVGEAGGGLVTVTMTGDFDVRSVHIDPQAVDPDDTTLLADLVAAAFRHAVSEAINLQSTGLGIEMPDVGKMLEGLTGDGDDAS
jgi:DNA-binding YbaB/EbfC family protein